MDQIKAFKWSAILKFIPGRQLILTVIYGVTRIGISLVWPYSLFYLVKNLDQRPVRELFSGILVVTLLLILSAILSHKQSTLNLRILQDFSTSLTNKVWKKMMNLEWRTFHSKSRVYYFDLIMMDTWRVRAGLSALLETLIVNGVIVLVLTFFIAVISMPLFLLCLGALLTSIAVQFLSSQKSRPYLGQFHNAWRHQHHWISKSVDQFDLIKLNRGYDESLASHQRNTAAFLASNGRMIESQAYWRNINQLVSNIVRVAILITGIYMVQNGHVTMQELLFVFLIVTVIQSNLTQTPGAFNNLMESQEALKSLLEFFELKEEKTAASPEIPPIRKITIRDLTFPFPDSMELLQTEFDLERGKIYLWKGNNGTGKSTAAHLLLGLLSPSEAKLTINDVPTDWNNLRDLRSRFAFLNQHSPIFMGSIKENTVFGHPEQDNAWTSVTGTWLSGLLPSGFATGERKVGERGEGISGGEAKRIALIRELLRDAEVLILDEPLNHLDQHAIAEIKREVINLKENMIIVIISHQNGFEDIADEIKQF